MPRLFRIFCHIALASINLDGRWTNETYSGPIMQKGGTSELFFAGDWLLQIGGDGTTVKSIVTTRIDVSPNRIRLDGETDDGTPYSLHGVYRVGDKLEVFRSLEFYFVTPRNTVADSIYAERIVELLTDRCFDGSTGYGDSPRYSYQLGRCRRANSVEPETNVPPAPKVDGVVLDSHLLKRNGGTFVEISIGAEDGLKVGHQLTVYRRGDSEVKHLHGTLRLQVVTPESGSGNRVRLTKRRPD